MLHRLLNITIVAVTFLTVFSSGCRPTNQASGSVTFWVTDNNGNALEGAKVVSEEQPAGQLKLTGLTDTNGWVSFNNITLGHYIFVISRFGFIQQEYEYTAATSQSEINVIFMIQQGGVSTTTSTVP